MRKEFNSQRNFCCQIWPLWRCVKNQSISKDIRVDTTLWRHRFCDAASPDFWREINLTMSYDMGEIQQYNNLNTLSYLFIPTYVISAQSDRLFNSWICSQYALSARSLSRAYRVKRGGYSLGKSNGCSSMLLVKLSSVLWLAIPVTVSVARWTYSSLGSSGKKRLKK